MAFGFGPQEMLDRAQVPDKWQLTPLRNFKSPRIRRGCGVLLWQY